MALVETSLSKHQILKSWHRYKKRQWIFWSVSLVKPFSIRYSVTLPPLELEIVRPKLMEIIDRIIGEDSSFFELFDIQSHTLDGVEGD